MSGPRAARPEGLDLLGGVLEGVPQLPLLEDRLVALVEVAQVRGLHVYWGRLDQVCRFVSYNLP